MDTAAYTYSGGGCPPAPRPQGSSVPRFPLILAVLGCAVAGGCRREPPPASQPSAPPALTLLTPGWSLWSREAAVARLAEQGNALSAAVRLVRLSGRSVLCLPEELTDATVRRLRILRLDERRWAFGLADVHDARGIRGPLLIAEDGSVTCPADGVEEEVLALYVSADADTFPHVLLQPDRVSLIDEEVEPALVLKEGSGVCFALRQERGIPYVALVRAAGPDPGELARFVWSPAALEFRGPAGGPLPDPPGGRYALDLSASGRLVPIGGDIPPPEPIRPRRPPPRDVPVDDESSPA